MQQQNVDSKQFSADMKEGISFTRFNLYNASSTSFSRRRETLIIIHLIKWVASTQFWVKYGQTNSWFAFFSYIYNPINVSIFDIGLKQQINCNTRHVHSVKGIVHQKEKNVLLFIFYYYFIYYYIFTINVLLNLLSLKWFKPLTSYSLLLNTKGDTLKNVENQ